MYSHSLNCRGPPSALSKSKTKTKTKTTAARRLKLLSQSAYKSHLRKEQSLKTLSKSLTVWLNFLLQNPKSCGCCSNRTDFDNRAGPALVIGKGKREGGELQRFEAEDGSCKEIFDVMSQVTKNIDEGRLRMKSHCPIDSSILTKMVVPSDTLKKNLSNCGIALQYLRQAGLKLYDQDGTEIIEDDVANGDKELVLSLLWNINPHDIKLEQLNSVDSTSLDLLLNWIQVICKKYDFCIDNFSSLIDGKAICCLLYFYFRKELAVLVFLRMIHEKLTRLLGNFPEALRMKQVHPSRVCVRLLSTLLILLTTDSSDLWWLLICKCVPITGVGKLVCGLPVEENC
ncbi:hypothetical protein Q3G72_004525 [Acer saccharum]|nr:hypothetical protein Q3G72_004525 [Acer saccharum]